MNLHEEAFDAGNDYRRDLLRDWRGLVARRRRAADRRRRQWFQPATDSPEAYAASLPPYRQALRELLGWPLTEPAPESVPAVEEIEVASDDLGRIRRLRIEVLPGVRAYGLLFTPPGAEPRPLVLSQHGGMGTPELTSGFFGSGNYNDMTRRLLRRGAHVFAPQLFRWNGRYGPDANGSKLDGAMRQLGGSIAAFELFCLQRCLDALAPRPEVDADRLGMAGLSYGGFHTLFAAALDTRLKAAVSSCFFNNRKVYHWADWSWPKALERFTDAEVAALVCPRRLYVEVGQKDTLFAVGHARAPARQAAAWFAAAGCPEHFVYHEHPGGHEFDPAEAPIAWLARQLAL